MSTMSTTEEAVTFQFEGDLVIREVPSGAWISTDAPVDVEDAR